MGLMLSRKEQESIQIGDDIKITVTEVRDGKARLFIEAPDAVSIMRTELLSQPARMTSLRRKHEQR